MTISHPTVPPHTLGHVHVIHNYSPQGYTAYYVMDEPKHGKGPITITRI